MNIEDKEYRELASISHYCFMRAMALLFKRSQLHFINIILEQCRDSDVAIDNHIRDILRDSWKL